MDEVGFSYVIVCEHSASVSFYGPFSTMFEAEQWMESDESNDGSEHRWIAPMNSPDYSEL